jgi:hypothetical protein
MADANDREATGGTLFCEEVTHRRERCARCGIGEWMTTYLVCPGVEVTACPHCDDRRVTLGGGVGG